MTTATDHVSLALAAARRGDWHACAEHYSQTPGAKLPPSPALAAPSSHHGTQAPRSWAAEQALASVETARHEAGHALVGIFLEVPIASAQVDRSGWSGVVHHYLPTVDVADQAALCWAGALAERQDLATATPRQVAPRLSESDRQGILDAVRHRDRESVRLFGDDVFSPTSLAAFEVARGILMRHRPALLALTAELKHRGTMTGAEVRNIIAPHLRY